MFGDTFYFQLIRKYVVLFGNLFNDINILRNHSTEDDIQVIKVPIQYANKEKFQARVEADANIDRPYAVLLPRMSFEITSLEYDGNRKLPSIQKVVKKITDESNELKYQFMPVPWDINFQLNIYVKKTEDGTKIVEQILPFFTPTFTVTLNLIPEMDVNVDVPITLVGCKYQDMNYGDNWERRTQLWTLDFNMKCYFYGPIKRTGIIKIANTTFYIANTADIRDSVNNVKPAERIILSPGMDANGNPITFYGPRPANTATVPYTEIDEDDDWGLIHEFESIEKFIID